MPPHPLPLIPPPTPASSAPTPDLAATHARLEPAVRGWFARRTAPRADLALDLAQRTWAAVTAALRSGRFDPARARLSTYVYAVMLNTWRDHARRDRADRLRHTDRDPLADDAQLPAHPHHTAEALDAVRDALAHPARAGLTPDQAFLLRLLGDGVTDRELAARLGIAPSTAHARRQAALAALRHHLARLDAPAPSANARLDNQPRVDQASEGAPRRAGVNP